MITVISSILILTACSNSSANSFIGTWEKVDTEEAGCRDSFVFKDNNQFEVQNSKLQGGKLLTGTYEHIENNDYKFNYSEGTNNFTIEVEDQSMTVTMAGSDNVCEYNKID
ncbi:hypothetical protein H9655_22225 [Cytobacillus sp. Sa5YUA1]|uniref:DUF5640 domain-containing protein n=1 Tax=Cytobacillus stercorigallinarum TaxID=2762240 RepID=A0ABR8QWG6_9BACI|nr:hypothetical protein [Cytobacillus stercorigallinarum]MBD7939762.1 hypothetical protein [Cytobacillus stercorigallinarum]